MTNERTEGNHPPVSLADISVIIAARNEEHTISACIRSVLAAAAGQAEIVVVDDGSTDRTLEVLRSFGEQVRVLQGGGRGPAHARNLAGQKTSRPWLAFTDADCEVAEDWLEKLSLGISGRSREVASIGGAQLVPRQAGKREKLIGDFLNCIGFVSDYLHTGGGVRPVQHNPTCNVLYQRQVLELAGGFDESLWPCEDLDLDLRLTRMGYTALFHPGAHVEHRRPATWRGLWRMWRRYGAAHAQLVRKHGICQKLHWLPLLVPLLMLSWLWPPLGLGLTLGGTLIFLVFFTRRTRSLDSGFQFTVFLAGITLAWLTGFYPSFIRLRRRRA